MCWPSTGCLTEAAGGQSRSEGFLTRAIGSLLWVSGSLSDVYAYTLCSRFVFLQGDRGTARIDRRRGHATC